MGLYRKILFGLVILGTLWLITIHTLLAKPTKSEDSIETRVDDTNNGEMDLTCNKISLVYTWVNGSDPAHIEARTKRSGNTQYSTPGNNRFRDLGGLMYSLRSAEKYAPWIEDIYIVTSGQVPGYLETSNPHVHIVPHSQIFHNLSDLPTFSSNAIESSFHNLPDSVGDCFIYLNDDMFFADHVEPSDFWTPEDGQILFKSGWTAPPPEARMNNIWHRSIGYTNKLLDQLWGYKEERNYASHGPYFFSMKVLRHMFNAFPHEFNITTAHPFRHEHDVSIPFLYNQFTIHYYKCVVADKTINSYLKIEDKVDKMHKEFAKIVNKHPKTVCLNDGLGEEPSPEVLHEMHSFFHELFPTKSQYESREDDFM